MHRESLKNLCWGAVEINLKAEIQWFNSSFERMTGFSLNDIMGVNLFNFFLQSDIDKKQARIHLEALKEGRNIVHESKIKNFNAGTIDVIINAYPLIDDQGKIIGSVGICCDVTAVKNNQREAESHSLQLKNDFLIENVNIQERQREFFSNQLNNKVSKTLTLASLHLQKATIEDKHNQTVYINIHKKITEALNEVRNISNELMPHVLRNIGLKDAIIELFNRHSRIEKSLFVFCCKTVDFDMIHISVQRCIYRIIEELTINTVKHSKASTIKAHLKTENQFLVLEFKDNGIGFDYKKIKKGYGISNIIKKVDLFGGDCNIKTVTGRGSYFTIEFPIDKISVHAFSKQFS
ncbi:MAG: PAS domain-containing protein [Ferruginibacter sp.]|nr:PAS domain-containing protein [Ferruginibacter sp.]